MRRRVRLDLSLLGRVARVESTDGDFIARLARCFEPSPQPCPTESNRSIDLQVQVERTRGSPPRGPEWVVTTRPPGSLESLRGAAAGDPARLVSALNAWAVTGTSEHYVFHAGAVARGNHGILLPAGPYGGKSTLTAGLVQRGLAFLSDEIGAVEICSGQLVGYPRALSLRRDVLPILGLGIPDGGPAADARMVSIAELGGARPILAVFPRLVIFPRFDAGRDEARRLSPGQAVIGLMETACSRGRFGARGLDFVIELAVRLPCYQVIFSDLTVALDHIERVLAGAVRELG